MSKYVKGLVQKQLEKAFSGVNEFVVVSVKGINGVNNNVIRGALRQNNIRISVVKNNLARNAFKNMGLEVSKGLFAGPCAIVYGGDSIVDVAKQMVFWAGKNKELEIKGAFLDGLVMDSRQAVALSKMPSRAELQGSIVRAAMSPGAKVAGAVAAPASGIAGCIKRLVEKLEKEAA
ncbi:MAG TPA: 50S ribosomal protein L10 [Sedimentisphaerales bacterium]|nr:50S ribosomal protein L10 [Sedimentisphaerales bacterium]